MSRQILDTLDRKIEDMFHTALLQSGCLDALPELLLLEFSSGDSSEAILDCLHKRFQWPILVRLCSSVHFAHNVIVPSFKECGALTGNFDLAKSDTN